MQYSANLNLLAAYQHFPELDANDLIVFDCIKKYSRSKAAKMQFENGVIWFWFNWTVVKEQLPIIKSNSRRSIDAHITALCNVGLLERHPDNRAKATSFFKLGANCDKLDFVEVTKEDYAAKTANPTPSQELPHLSKILPSSNISVEPLQNSAKPSQDFAKPSQEMEKVLTQTFAKSCQPLAESCKHIIHIDSNNSVENKFSTDNNKEEAREIFEEKINAENAEIFASFDEKCKVKGLLEVLKIKKRFSEQKLAEKIFEFGESDFWAMVEQIDAHLANNKKAKYSDLPAVLVKWFGTADENAAKNALNNFWRAKFGFEYESITNWSKAQKTAIKSIGVKIRESVAAKSKINVADVSTKQLREAVEKFFGALPPKWSDVKWFKLETIASSFSAIMAAISEEHKAKKTAAVIQEQATADKPKSFGEKCAEILVGATPEDASQIAHRIAPKLKLRGDEIILKALSGMVAWAARTNTVITNDDSIGQTVEDYCNFIINKRKEAK